MMTLFLLVSLLPLVIAQAPTQTAPIIIDQGPTRSCFNWGSGPETTNHPTSTADSCPGPSGAFNLGNDGWNYPSEWDINPGWYASVSGADGTPLTVDLVNDGKDTDCDRALEVALSFDYPGSALYDNLTTTDLSQYDSIIVEYDAVIKYADTTQSTCNCNNSGEDICPSW